MENVAENPAPVIGIIGTILAALFAAMVGLLTLFVNSRNAAKSQKDTQFYEALKRFGDKDSPTIRSSAAGLLEQMAQTEWLSISLSRKIPFVGKLARRPYLDTAIDQLLSGFLLEENTVVLTSIGSALERLVNFRPEKLAIDFYVGNVNITSDLLSKLAKLFVCNGVSSRPNPDGMSEQNAANVWRQAATSSMYYDESILRGFISMLRTPFLNRFDQNLQAYGAPPPAEKSVLLVSAQEQVRISFDRLWGNVFLLCTALRARRGDTGEGESLSFSFLAKGKLSEADLSRIDLSFSMMDEVNLSHAILVASDLSKCSLRNANLTRAKLADSSLQGANLRDADLEGADLTDTRFGEVIIDDSTNLEGCNWWNADIRLTSSEEEAAPDTKLLDVLFRRYGNAVPSDLEQVHFSVRDYLNQRPAPETQEEA